MKKGILLAAMLALFSGAAFAQDEAQYDQWMKDTSATVASLTKNLEENAGPAASADAKKLQDIFQQVHSFWERRNTADAAKFAADARSGFQQVAELASTGKIAEAGEALTAARTNCQGCHQAHRERGPDGNWRIKQ